MVHGGGKRKHEDDWDFLDLTGSTPVYSKSVHSSQSSSRSVASAPGITGRKPKPASAVPSGSTTAAMVHSYGMTAAPRTGHPVAPSTTNAPTTVLPGVDTSTSRYFMSSPRHATHSKSKNLSASPGSPSFPLVHSPPAKKARKGKGKAVDVQGDADKPEKRGAIMKTKCPMNILERVDRVMSQRFFLIDRRREDDELREEFSVLGSTGNVYTVIIDKTPSCNCPDANRGNHCKHILFVFLKVLQVPQSSHVWYQKALLTSELYDVFSSAPLAPNSMANQRVREAYARATGKAVTRQGPESGSSTDLSNPAKVTRRQPTKEDDCPICYECMHGATENALVWCETCGNSVHKECFSEWAKSSSRNITCVFCRSPWSDPSLGKGKGKNRAGNAGSRVSTSEGYLNLASVAGLSRERDTTTYYHGPRRGTQYYRYEEDEFI